MILTFLQNIKKCFFGILLIIQFDTQLITNIVHIAFLIIQCKIILLEEEGVIKPDLRLQPLAVGPGSFCGATVILFFLV